MSVDQKPISDNPVFQESYYHAAPTKHLHWPTEPIQLHAQPGAIAASLSDIVDQVIPARPGTLIIVLFVIMAGAIKFGWELRGLFGPIWDNRGWGALVVFSIVGSVYMVNYCNRK